jgi:hypothetical protein
MLERLASIDASYTSGPGGGGTDVAGLVRVFESVADRGGYVTADKQVDIETAKGRLLLAALALEAITPEQRQKLIAQWATEDKPASEPESPALVEEEKP